MLFEDDYMPNTEQKKSVLMIVMLWQMDMNKQQRFIRTGKLRNIVTVEHIIRNISP